MKLRIEMCELDIQQKYNYMLIDDFINVGTFNQYKCKYTIDSIIEELGKVEHNIDELDIQIKFIKK